MSITLKAARVNAKFTQLQAAEALGVSVPTLIGYEAGRVNMPVNILDKILRLYNCRYEDLDFSCHNDTL